ncbi:MAG: hypothetical protein FJ009_21375 [Chloroflexi bacterium]|nr:hypothetical protein [Chloroflexota bacterium]
MEKKQIIYRALTGMVLLLGMVQSSAWIIPSTQTIPEYKFRGKVIEAGILSTSNNHCYVLINVDEALSGNTRIGLMSGHICNLRKIVLLWHNRWMTTPDDTIAVQVSSQSFRGDAGETLVKI